jgi:hypothetical protein
MKKNTISVLFLQIIAARTAERKNADGTVTEVTIPERKVMVEFKEETDSEVNAKNLAQYFMTRLVAWQKLRPLQGKDGFQTSKPMEVTLTVNNKTLTSSMKFTINPERIEKCLDRSENLVALIANAASAPKFGASDASIKNYLLATPQNVILAKEIPAKDVAAAKAAAKKALVVEPMA